LTGALISNTKDFILGLSLSLVPENPKNEKKQEEYLKKK
jgi:hypothetical protein